MKGLNELFINSATMREILQHYFDTVMFKEGQSPHIDYVSHRNSASGDDFVLRLKDRETEKITK